MNECALTLDLVKTKQRQQQTIFVRQGDQNGTTIVAAITDHGAAISGTVTACAIVMKLPDGTHYYRKGASWADGTATVTIDERQAASVVGRTLLAYFTVTVGDSQYSTGAFAVVVEPDAVGDAELPEDYDTAIQDAIDNANAAAAAAEEAAAAVAGMAPLTNAEIDAITAS